LAKFRDEVQHHYVPGQLFHGYIRVFSVTFTAFQVSDVAVHTRLTKGVSTFG